MITSLGELCSLRCLVKSHAHTHTHARTHAHTHTLTHTHTHTHTHTCTLQLFLWNMQFEYHLLLQPKVKSLPPPSCSDFYLVNGQNMVGLLSPYSLVLCLSGLLSSGESNGQCGSQGLIKIRVSRTRLQQISLVPSLPNLFNIREKRGETGARLTADCIKLTCSNSREQTLTETSI